jgi:hypothetical protein
MNYTAIEAEILHGRITVKEPQKLPEQGRGLLIVLPHMPPANIADRPRSRVRLPLIHGDAKRKINPTPEELDDSLWD